MADSTRPTFVVTGASGGLGLEFVRKLSAHDVNVACADVVEGDIRQVAESLGLGDDRFLFVATDISDPSSVQALFTAVKGKWGRLDGMANIAGILGPVGKIIDADLKDVDRILSVNVRGLWLMLHFGIPDMVASGGGAIVNIGSYASIRGGNGQAAYAASKHAIVGLTKSTALEYATEGITANVVSPGSMNAPMMRVVETTVGDGDAERGRRIMESRIPQGRVAEPSEIAEVGTWLLREAPSHLTGQVITVDGARSAG